MDKPRNQEQGLQDAFGDSILVTFLSLGQNVREERWIRFIASGSGPSSVHTFGKDITAN